MFFSSDTVAADIQTVTGGTYTIRQARAPREPSAMTKPASTSRSFFRFLILSLVCLLASMAVWAEDTGLSLGSKAPYTPQQDPSTYEAPPTGFSPIFTEIVARHGSRGLSSPSNDLAIYNMWLQAQGSGGLTKVGMRLGDDLQRNPRECAARLWSNRHHGSRLWKFDADGNYRTHTVGAAPGGARGSAAHQRGWKRASSCSLHIRRESRDR
jgi:hypothetical protein